MARPRQKVAKKKGPFLAPFVIAGTKPTEDQRE
jgi:hypothetical protein